MTVVLSFCHMIFYHQNLMIKWFDFKMFIKIPAVVSSFMTSIFVHFCFSKLFSKIATISLVLLVFPEHGTPQTIISGIFSWSFYSKKWVFRMSQQRVGGPKSDAPRPLSQFQSPKFRWEFLAWFSWCCKNARPRNFFRRLHIWKIYYRTR